MKRSFISLQVKPFSDANEKSLILQENTLQNIPLEKLHKEWITHSIETIYLGDYKLSDTNLDVFIQCITSHSHTLKTLSIDNVKMSDKNLATIINSLTKQDIQVKTITFTNFTIGPLTTKALARFLKLSRSIETIEFDNNHLQTENIKIIAAALTNATIKTFKLNQNKMDPESMQAFAKALKSNAIEIIQFKFNEMNENALKFLVDALKFNTFIKTLDLEGNKIGNQGAKIIAEIIQYNSSLKVLCLKNNKIGQEGLNALSKAIQSNGHLRSIDLQKNEKIENFKPLADAMKVNETITTIDLSYNKIKDKVAPITDIINHHNPNLIHLNLGACKIDNVGIQKIAQPLKVNGNTLQTLDVSMNNISNSGVKFFASSHIQIQPKLNSNEYDDQATQALDLQKRFG
jgi:Ran GTPase-activating protein (RanGAP) involved in mRNA processing and transport